MAIPAQSFPRPAPGPDRAFEFELRELVFAGLRGEKGALDKALERCDDALARDPADPEALVWRGSTKIALSGEAYRGGDFERGSTLWNEGIEEMRTARRAAPDRIDVLIPRAATLLGAAGYHPIPAEAQRLYGEALRDYRRVYEIQRPHLERLSEHARGELLMSLVDAFRRVGRWREAEPYLRQAVESLSGTTYGAEAERLLALAGEPERVKTCHGCHDAGEER